MKKIILFLSFILTATFSFSQIEISGKVTDNNGMNLPGVTVMIKDQNVGTTTNFDGKYKIVVDETTSSLVFSYIGYANQEVVIGDQRTINIAMSISVIDLDKVVVTASRKKEKLLEAPASIAVIGAEKIEQNISLQPIDNIQNISGVDVSKTGITSSNVASRGFNNIFSGSVLTMVDNRVASVPSLRVNSTQLIPGNNDDIASIEVLKGPASAIYGPFSSNGVMHILTKSPFNIDGNSETKVSYGFGDRSIKNASVRTSTKLSDKVAVKISANRIKGNDWEYVDQAEIDGAAGFAAANAANGQSWGTNPNYIYLHKQNPDSAGGRYYLNDSVSVDRDNTIDNWNIDGRIDYKINKDAKLILAAGHSVINGIELTGLGAGQGINWTYDYYQARYTNKSFFAQVYKNTSDAGDTYLRRSGNLIVDKSEFISYQLQNTSEMGDLSLTYGMDAFLTRPNTEGTINGQFEDDDNIDEIGYYVQGKWKMNDKIDIIGALRSDQHTWVEGNQISPRAALIYKVNPQSTFRATYNKAFESPSALNFSLDLFAARMPISGPLGYDIVGTGNRNGLNFNRDVNGTLQYVDLLGNTFSLNDQMGANSAYGIIYAGTISSVTDGLMAAMGLDQATASSIANSYVNSVFPAIGSLSGLTNELRVFNPSTFEFSETISPDQIVDIKALKNSVNETREIGYQGLITDNISLSVDVWETEYKDFISPLTIQTPNVFVNATSFAQAFATGINYSAAEYNDLLMIIDAIGGNADGSMVDEITTQMAMLPHGTVTPDENGDILMTYANFGNVKVNGIDIAGTYYMSSKTTLGFAGSWVNKDQFETEEGLTIALNAPKRKYNFSFNTELMKDVKVGLTHRWQAGFPVNSGVYVGDLPEFRTTDLSVGYQILPTSRIDLSVQNIGDNKHQQFIGAPEMGRLMLLRVSHNF